MTLRERILAHLETVDRPVTSVEIATALNTTTQQIAGMMPKLFRAEQVQGEPTEERLPGASILWSLIR